MQAGKIPKNPRIAISMPPMTDGFDLPTREDLLNIRPGEHVKLILSPKSGKGLNERMWVILKKKVSDAIWIGVLDNNPLALPIRRGDVVEFHPLAVIATMTRAEGMQLKQAQESTGA